MSSATAGTAATAATAGTAATAATAGTSIGGSVNTALGHTLDRTIRVQVQHLLLAVSRVVVRPPRRRIPTPLGRQIDPQLSIAMFRSHAVLSIALYACHVSGTISTNWAMESISIA